MKRIIILATLLLAASGCATTTEAPSNNAPTQPSNANAAATPKAATSTSAADSDVAAKEKEIWDAIKKKDSAAFAAMLADDFLYVTNDGVYDKAGTVDGVKQLELTDITFSDWKTVMLDKDAAVVTYTVNMKGTSGGQPAPPTPVRGGSVWVNRGGKWIAVFHQQTEVEPPPPDMTGNKPAATTATTTPTEAKPAEPVAADPIAREKQVWDAIKKKDYDRFASFLAEDQIEVSPWGVNDKAGSVKGVQRVDLSKAVMSDFKTLKINDAATAVIYMAKGPTPPFPKEGERSSTIWVNRGGKWLAAYHQATHIKPAAPKSK